MPQGAVLGFCNLVLFDVCVYALFGLCHQHYADADRRSLLVLFNRYAAQYVGYDARITDGGRNIKSLAQNRARGSAVLLPRRKQRRSKRRSRGYQLAEQISFNQGGVSCAAFCLFGPDMKKTVFLFLSLLLTGSAWAETVQLKNGTLISGSITSQTEYTINLTTSYGPVVLNQREVQAILPDKHRVHLKGGSQLVGVIIDLDEFNLKLQTDEGIVNIDMPQILSVEVYDYEQGNTTQKIAQQQQEQRAQQQAAVATAAATSAAGGLTFDSDIEKVFDVKKAEVVNGQAQTVKEISAAEIRARRAAAMSDEEAFLKGVSSQERQAAIAEQAQAARSGKLEKAKKAKVKKDQRAKEKSASKFFELSVGAQNNKLKLDNTGQPGFAGTAPYDVGGTSVRVEGSFLWRVGDSNLWAGPTLAIANLTKNSFLDLDPAVPPGSATVDVTTSGQFIDLMAKTNYFINPQQLITLYLTAGAGYRFLTLNYHGVIQGENFNTGAVLGVAGLGVQTYLDDVLVGLEVTEHFSKYSGKFSHSSSASTVFALTFSWKF